MSGAPILSIDLGGSKILAALVNGATVLESRRTATPREKPVEAWLDAIAALVADWRGRFRQAGIAVTGGIADGAWFPLNPETLPVPPGFSLENELARRLGVTVTAANDGQAAAWGEYRFGAAQQCDMIFLTISTGIGGGIVIDGRLRSGRHGLAGHIGIMTGGHDRMLEQRGSGSALARLAAGSFQDADPPAVFSAAEAGQNWALQLIDQVAAPVASMIADLQLALDPDCFVIGGGMGLQPLYLDRLDAALRPLPDHLRPILRAAALGANAGLVGMADLVSIADRATTPSNAQQGKRL